MQTIIITHMYVVVRGSENNRRKETKIVTQIRVFIQFVLFSLHNCHTTSTILQII